MHMASTVSNKEMLVLHLKNMFKGKFCFSSMNCNPELRLKKPAPEVAMRFHELESCTSVLESVRDSLSISQDQYVVWTKTRQETLLFFSPSLSLSHVNSENVPSDFGVNNVQKHQWAKSAKQGEIRKTAAGSGRGPECRTETTLSSIHTGRHLASWPCSSLIHLSQGENEDSGLTFIHRISRQSRFYLTLQ